MLQLTGVAELLYAAGIFAGSRSASMPDVRWHAAVILVVSHRTRSTHTERHVVPRSCVVHRSPSARLAYRNRVTLLAKMLGQSETRINRQLKRKPR